MEMERDGLIWIDSYPAGLQTLNTEVFQMSDHKRNTKAVLEILNDKRMACNDNLARAKITFRNCTLNQMDSEVTRNQIISKYLKDVTDIEELIAWFKQITNKEN